LSKPVNYIERTRDYYLSQGYDKPYQWAHFEEVPFTAMRKPLSECRIALVSTSDIAVRGAAGGSRDKTHEDKVGSVYTIPTDTPTERLFSRQEHYDKAATHLDDVNTYFPISRLQEAAARGRVGSVSPECYGVYTAYSQKQTVEHDAPEVLARCRKNEVDVAVMTPV
jgi:hypothetical protein